MTSEQGHTTIIQQWLTRLGQGDEQAREELIRHSCDRLHQLAHRFLRGFPEVGRWVQTDDVLQDALFRLHRALGEIHPDSVVAFLGLAGLQIRLALLDLKKKLCGAWGHAAHYDSGGAGQDSIASRRVPAADTTGPSTLAEWTEFHELVGRLPPEERELFDLHYYGGLTHGEVAELLQLPEITVKRRWRKARLHLHAALHGKRPGE
jgi:RNA polymerase sigma factor (sigma-70 family)